MRTGERYGLFLWQELLSPDDCRGSRFMKILVIKEYHASCSSPFKANARVNGVWFVGSSRESYEDAERDLLDKVRKQLSAPPAPEPREVEIEL